LAGKLLVTQGMKRFPYEKADKELRPFCSVSSNQRGFTLAELLVTTAIVGLVMAAVLSVQMSGATISQTSSNKAEAQQSARAAMMMEEDLRAAGYGYPPSQSQITPPGVGANVTANIITAATASAITFTADVANASTSLTGAVNSAATVLPVTDASKIAVNDIIYLINYTQASSLVVKTITGNNITTVTGVTCPGVPPPCYPAGAVVGRARPIAYSWDAATLTLSKDATDGSGSLPVVTGVQAFQLRYFDANDAEILPANLAANLPNIRRVMIDLTARSATALNQGTFRGTSSVRPRNL